MEFLRGPIHYGCTFGKGAAVAGSGSIEVVYHFRCMAGDKREAKLRVVMNATTLETAHRMDPPPPPWAALDVCQCRVCPLNADESPYCPAALSFRELMAEFGDLLSYTEVEATVITRERTISAATTVQKALSSLVGLRMATCGCPILAKFKPMARFHLPFATTEETVFRAASAYLLAQYFLKRRGKEADLDLAGLRKTYALIHEVNIGLAERLRTIPSGDAHLNALVILDVFAHALPSSIDDNLAEIEHLFGPYFDSGG